MNSASKVSKITIRTQSENSFDIYLLTFYEKNFRLEKYSLKLGMLWYKKTFFLSHSIHICEITNKYLRQNAFEFQGGF